MILEMLGCKSIKVNGDVQVDYKVGKTVIYFSETTKHIILNPDSIVAVAISEKEKII